MLRDKLAKRDAFIEEAWSFDPPLFAAGQWWRLWTANFVHGVAAFPVHLGFNLIGLVGFGHLVELLDERVGGLLARHALELQSGGAAILVDGSETARTAGIEEGRIAYNNIRNVIYLLISTGAAEVILVALALIFGSPIPLLPVQLLWLNLVTNGIQDVALAFENYVVLLTGVDIGGHPA